MNDSMKRIGGGMRLGAVLGAVAIVSPVLAQDDPPAPAPVKSTARQPKRLPPGPIPDHVAISAMRERALGILVEAASSPDGELRANAIEALAKAPGRLEPILALALKDPTIGVRTVAAMAVGRTKMTKLIPSVEPLLKDTSPYVRAAAIFAMRSCDPQFDPSGLAPILVSDPSPKVRAHVAFILGELGDASAAGMLRQAAKDSMARLPVTDAQVKLMRLQISEALIKLGDESQVEAVRAALYPSRPEELESAALAVQIIGQVRDRGAIDQLIYLSGYKDKDQQMPAEIRLAVAGSLARMGHTEGGFIADEYLTSALPTVRAQAAYVFGETGRLENLNRLETLLADPAPNVRVTAAAGILKVAEAAATAAAGR
jgi:HEAT repeat protein